jgi:CRP-like cAMP-binding protein
MAIGQSEFLWGLPPGDAARVESLGTPVHFESGATVFELGTSAETVYVLERGRIALTLPVQVGGRQEDILVEERQAGQTVGWSALIPPHRFTLKAAALVETEAVAFPRTALLDLFTANPTIGYAVTRNLAAVIGHRLTVFQTMWTREMQRMIDARTA